MMKGSREAVCVLLNSTERFADESLDTHVPCKMTVIDAAAIPCTAATQLALVPAQYQASGPAFTCTCLLQWLRLKTSGAQALVDGCQQPAHGA